MKAGKGGSFSIQAPKDMTCLVETSFGRGTMERFFVEKGAQIP